ncbi:DUF6538 domain-containing protein [Stenotrophomonas maltophilia]|uniref:DUF6538 domain-containing protein n=1 Tax=Stenotrophomonas maltophilia TaxID=40324 RepID=UPI0039C20E00
MRLPSYLTRSSTGRYQFRMRVPTDMRGIVGKPFVKHPLGIHLHSARVAALAIAQRYAQAFDAIRDGCMTKKGLTVEDVLRSVAENGSRRYEIDLPGFRLRTTDAADHARAMEALEEIGKFHFRDAGAVPAAAGPNPLESVAAQPLPAETISLIDAKRIWQDKVAAEDIEVKTVGIKLLPVTELIEFLGAERELHTITRPEMARFYDHLAKRGLTRSTLNNRQSYLGGKRGFFTWAMASGYVLKGDNVAAGHVSVSMAEKRKRRKFGFQAFTLEQVHQLFAPDSFRQLSTGARWAALLGLYTGARAGEVGQLFTLDVKEEEGIPCIRFTDEGEDQRLKTDVSNRVVPLHPDLIKLGFLDYVAERRESGDWRLFPQADSKAKNGAGNWISKAFSYYLQKHCGGWPKAKRGFHSLRKTVIQEMQGSGVASEMRAQIVGHELDDEHHATYSRPFTVSEKLNGAGGTPALGVLDYGIDLEALRTLPARKVGRRSSNTSARPTKVGGKGRERN